MPNINKVHPRRFNRQPSAQPAKKQRLDQLLVDRNLADSREHAMRLIMAGEVLVDDATRDKPGQLVAGDAPIRVRNRAPFVSRGGQKLEAALTEFVLDVTGLIAVDVGASTGGFTDCLLQRGVSRVYAVDVDYGQLAWKLRKNERVVPIERTNIRNLLQLPDGVLADLAVIDAIFISLALVLPAALRLLKPRSQIVALIKPQFEANRKQVEKGGVIRNATVHRAVLEENCDLAAQLALSIMDMTISPLLGPAGNVEFLVWYRRSPAGAAQPPAVDIGIMLDRLLDQAAKLRTRYSKE